MTAPDYVPAPLGDQPRKRVEPPPPRPWMANRPGDLQSGQPIGPTLGRPGPDQGYAHSLAERFKDRLQLAEGEHLDDVLAGCAEIALKRASFFGRAPVIHDLAFAFGLWGFLGGAPPDLLEQRRFLFTSAGHMYWDRRRLADMVPEDTLRLTPAQVQERLADWRSLVTG